jgi:hypothetical protein
MEILNILQYFLASHRRMVVGFTTTYAISPYHHYG